MTDAAAICEAASRPSMRLVPIKTCEQQGVMSLQDKPGAHHQITKRGDDYLRTLLIQGAKSAVMSAPKRDDPISRWLVQLTARVGWQKAWVAMADKNAHILWAVMTREQGFNPRHVSTKPPARLPIFIALIAGQSLQRG